MAAKSQVVVKYDAWHGIVGEREITGAQWKSAGVEGMHKTVWNEGNHFMVDATEWPVQALEIVRSDPEFKVIEGDAAHQDA